MFNLKDLANSLAVKGSLQDGGFPFEVNPIPGDVEVLQIVVEDREELPIFISASDDQVICISYLFKESEIATNAINEMNKAMLVTNITMPLSSFAKVDDQYVIYGALSVNSTVEDIVHEIEILSSNTIDAIEAMSDYLN